jgi:hypothetical protein
MTFTFKLSQRLARSRTMPLAAARVPFLPLFSLPLYDITLAQRHPSRPMGFALLCR